MEPTSGTLLRYHSLLGSLSPSSGHPHQPAPVPRLTHSYILHCAQTQPSRSHLHLPQPPAFPQTTRIYTKHRLLCTLALLGPHLTASTTALLLRSEEGPAQPTGSLAELATFSLFLTPISVPKASEAPAREPFPGCISDPVPEHPEGEDPVLPTHFCCSLEQGLAHSRTA